MRPSHWVLDHTDNQQAATPAWHTLSHGHSHHTRFSSHSSTADLRILVTSTSLQLQCDLSKKLHQGSWLLSWKGFQCSQAAGPTFAKLTTVHQAAIGLIKICAALFVLFYSISAIFEPFFSGLLSQSLCSQGHPASLFWRFHQGCDHDQLRCSEHTSGKSQA